MGKKQDNFLWSVSILETICQSSEGVVKLVESGDGQGRSGRYVIIEHEGDQHTLDSREFWIFSLGLSIGSRSQALESAKAGDALHESLSAIFGQGEFIPLSSVRIVEIPEELTTGKFTLPEEPRPHYWQCECGEGFGCQPGNCLNVPC